MSILDSFDLSDWNNGVKDAFVENYLRFKEAYGHGANSALVATENCPFYDIKDEFNFVTKYLDLSSMKEGDYDRYMEMMRYWVYDGIMLDNIDRIPENKDMEYWQEFVRFALKKEMDFPLNQTTGVNRGIIDFDKLHVAARSIGGFPDYLQGKSIQCSVIGLGDNN